jgi:pimeloyl-ACP methyl ester carboxylesterase
MNEKSGKIRVSETVEIAYRECGNGEPLIMLHAFPLSQKMWDAQFNYFAQTHRPITFDWRGFGESSIGSEISTMENFADDAAQLMTALQVEKATLCGLSMGGYAALAFYRKYPQRVSALILADTRAGADSEEGKRTRYEIAEMVRQSGASRIADKMIPQLISEKTQQKNSETAIWIRNIIEANSPPAIAAALRGMAERQDSSDLLSVINCPTLIIVGSNDVLTPPVESEKMANQIRHSQLEIIDEAGHLSNIENPEKFNQVAAEFLKRG